jgi:hypothetical protein
MLRAAVTCVLCVAVQVDHFVRFADDERQMPVVWHQTLLCFVQRYKVSQAVGGVRGALPCPATAAAR